MTVKTINHWGVWVTSDSPVTGVISNNSISQFISDEISSNGINLDWEAFQDSVNSDESLSDEDKESALESYEEFEDTYLIGDWAKDENGLYIPADCKGGDYSAIVRSDVTQVVKSKYTKRVRLCSPCFPGQGDNDSKGEFLAYDLPPEAYDN